MNLRLLIEGRVNLLPETSQEFIITGQNKFHALTIIIMYDKIYAGNKVFAELKFSQEHSKLIGIPLLSDIGVSERTSSFDGIYSHGLEGKIKLIFYSTSELNFKFKIFVDD